MNKCIQFLAFVVFLSCALQVHAQNAGSITFAAGDVTAERQPAAALAKGDAVLVSDAVVTGPSSRAQIMMIDGARIAIRPDSRIVINEYNHAAAAPAGTPVSTTEDSSVISLVKGGLRSVTGVIGKEQPQNVEVRTAVGVLGIRGTDFAVLLCGSCNEAPGVAPGATVPQGLYIMVSDGVVIFRNETAELELQAGEFAFVPLTTRIPARMDVPPPVFADDSQFRFEPESGASNGALPSGFDRKLGLRRDADPAAPPPETEVPDSSSSDGSDSNSTPAQPIIGIDADGNPVDLTPGNASDPSNRTITWSTGPAGAADAIFASVLDNATTRVLVDGTGNLTGFDNFYPQGNATDVANFQIGSATNQDTGFDSITVLRWGRWAGGAATIGFSDGSSANQDLSNQSLHWVASEQWVSPVALPVRGIANYSLIGASSPTDNLGNVGVLGDASFQADFTSLRVTSSLSIDINGSSWIADGTGNFDTSPLFQGNYGAVSIDGIGGGNGVFSGFFSAPGNTSDPTFPGGVGLTYSLQDMTGSVSVSGAAVFGNP